ncbi:CAP domain-containing protein [Companilactobacillus nantensis]|uniref:Cell surface protein n=1 Tax=Companilactobacillus nantensis DSM 16982 TaxID=1423774 RepID=A0A0R1WK44_9LACO|nr:CAP domain-containing protein [Companilactobacillus nantensis]KRM17797.1 cell surface protein [Companilactobacillus nantensis DSM 16982]GEO63496.1 hypothetical protein LNA01_06790 [Companilactobacillus nantensis]
MKKNKLASILIALTITIICGFSTNNISTKAATRPTFFVRNVTKLYTSEGKLISNRALGPYTTWAVGKVGFIDGSNYAQVATNEYVFVGDGQIYNDNPDDDVQLTNYKPDINKINEYVVKYVNAIHAANGTQPVHTSADFISYANQRAAQQTKGHLDHSTATRETSENLSSDGYHYLLFWGYVHSDKDVAYYLLKSWYDETFNMWSYVGTRGHFGHRAAIIYSGPTVAVGMSDDAASFVADWAPGNDFMNLYNYTGTSPDTKFVSKDSVQ